MPTERPQRTLPANSGEHNMAATHALTHHPLAGCIAFIVDRAIREGTSVAVTRYAERLIAATPDGRITLADLKAEMRRVAVFRGASLEWV